MQFAIYKYNNYICTQYNCKYKHMDLSSRLRQFMEYMNIPVTKFADSCLIPRPSMTQLLKGRNKKVSDEVITKIHQAYPQLSVMWLLFGEGDMMIGANIETSEAQKGRFYGDLLDNSVDNKIDESLFSDFEPDLKNKQTRETDIPEVEFATSTSNKEQGYYSPMARMHDSLPGGAASKNSEKRHVDRKSVV